MSARAKVTLYHDTLRALDRAAIRALEQTADALLTEIVQAQVIPYREGTLQGDATFVDVSHSEHGMVEIVSSTPYARRLYFHPEYNFSHEENPNAKAHWFEDWADGGKNEDVARKIFAAIYEEEAGL